MDFFIFYILPDIPIHSQPVFSFLIPIILGIYFSVLQYVPYIYSYLTICELYIYYVSIDKIKNFKYVYEMSVL